MRQHDEIQTGWLMNHLSVLPGRHERTECAHDGVTRAERAQRTTPIGPKP